jgi:3-methylcrotonyl-CoA carboxylase alpha subunit
MKFRLKIAQETVEIDADPSDGEDRMHITIEKRDFDVRFQRITEHHIHLIVNGRATGAFVVQSEEGKHIFMNGRSFLVRDEDRTPSRLRKQGAEDTPGEVTPPMPAVVVRILVEESEEVKRGQGLVVVSAMKMETTLVAPAKGRVTRINTSVDAKVVPGDILVEIEKQESSDG